MNMGPENNEPDDDRTDRRYENGTGRHVLGLTDQRVKLLRGGIGEELQGCIERLSGPNRSGGQDDPAPFGRAEMKEKTGHGDEDGADRMNPGIMLGTKDVKNAVDGVSDALDSSGKLKAVTHGSGGIRTSLDSL